MFLCYELRLDKTARAAVSGHYDYFCTTLSISPLKMPKRLMRLVISFRKNIISAGFPPILRKKKDSKGA